MPQDICVGRYLCIEVYVLGRICSVVICAGMYLCREVYVPVGICAVCICARRHLGLPTQLLKDFNQGIIHKSSSKYCVLTTNPGRCCANSE